MLLTIEQFRHRIEKDCSGLVSELQDLTGRYGSAEALAWKNSLGQLSRIFQAPSFQPLHLYLGSRGNLALEYQLPAASSWCDVVLLGAHQGTPSAVIVELKDWITRADKPGRFEGLIERQGAQELHPSDQVRGYTEYCRRFHSGVSECGAKVHGCVIFTRDPWVASYALPPNRDLVSRYPLFTVAADDISVRLPSYFGDRLTLPDESFARAFSNGRYRQNRGFVAQIGAQILDPKSNAFELLDNQRKAFALCNATITQTFLGATKSTPPRKVIVVKGPPGSGKSVIAARLWASLVTNTALPPGDVVFTTTSLSQSSNWMHLFDRAAGVEAARGVVRKATGYCPITTQRVSQLRRRHGPDLISDAARWRDHLATLQALGEPQREGARDDQNLVSIVDEAHALINPEHIEGRGQFGFVVTLGPQAFHVIRTSLLTVFLLDPLQGFRQRENTTLDDIRRWSRELGAGDPEEISLEGAQFRCAGSTDYVAWIESVLDGLDVEKASELARVWTESGQVLRASDVGGFFAATGITTTLDVGRPRMDFEVFDNPEPWEALLRKRETEGNSVRLLSTDTRPWKTEDATDPHRLPPHLMDFHEPYKSDGVTRYWSRIWNFLPRSGDYTWFVTAHPGGRIAQDPLCEVGCPYAVRGFDYDYIGIIWLNDLLWRSSCWQVDPRVVTDSGLTRLTAAARAEIRAKRKGPAMSELQDRVVQAYRILFTRGLKGVYVWIPDAETRAHVQASLSANTT